MILKELAVKYAETKTRFYYVPRRLIELDNIIHVDDDYGTSGD